MIEAYRKQLFDNKGVFRGEGMRWGRSCKSVEEAKESLKETVGILNALDLEVSEPTVTYEVTVLGQKTGGNK